MQCILHCVLHIWGTWALTKGLHETMCLSCACWCKFSSQGCQHAKKNNKYKRVLHCGLHIWGIWALTKRTPRENAFCSCFICASFVCFACGLARCCRSLLVLILFSLNSQRFYMNFSWCVCCNSCPIHFILDSNTFCDLTRNSFPRHFKRIIGVLEYPQS